MSDITNIVLEASAPTAKVIDTKSMNLVDREALEVHLMGDCVQLTLSNGVVKYVSIDDFRSMLNTAVGQVERENLEGFSLPSNCFYFAKSATQIQLSCYHPEQVKPIQYLSSKRSSIVPNIIVSYVLQKTSGKWNISSALYFCTDLTVSQLPKDFIRSPSASKRIWLLPMTNTYDNGTLCYGANRMPSVFDNNLRGLDWYYQVLFESPFNNDLGIRALGYDFRNDSNYISKWYKKLAEFATDIKPFPYSDLEGYSPR